LLPSPPLLLITDRAQARRPLADVVTRACTAGCRWISLREKDLAPDAQIALADSLKPIAQRYGACLSLHGAAATARAAGLDAVHLPGGGDWAGARALLGPHALIGVSIHSAAEASRLDTAVDYAVAGPVFETASKPGYGPTLGAAGLAALCAVSTVPIVAIGGIEPETVRDIMDSGAAGIAVMGSVMRAAEPGGVIKQLLAELATARVPQRAG
jgi:thiamine-phosphate pyrophosphorylase